MQRVAVGEGEENAGELQRVCRMTSIIHSRVDIAKLISNDDSAITGDTEGIGALHELARAAQLERRQLRDVQELILAGGDEESLITFSVGRQESNECCMVRARRDELSSPARDRQCAPCRP